MCKSIKKSCFVIALSFMSFAFFSVDVNAALYIQKPASSMSAAEKERMGQLIIEIDTLEQNGDSWVQEAPIDMSTPNPMISGFNAKQNVEYTVKIKDSKGKVYGTEKLRAQGKDLKAVIPAAALEPAPAAEQ